MTEKEQQKAAKEFAEYWKDKGYEKGESQAFWLSLLRDIYGVDHPEKYISFEEQVKLDHASFIDGYIEATHVMIEQKSFGKDLRKSIKQSDGSVLSPFQQAKRYASELPYSKRPRWIVTCNFTEFLVYDMERPNGEPEQIYLKDLPKEYYRLQFLVNADDENLKKEMEISLKAGELVGELYDAILKQYKKPDSPETLKSLNMLCVRLVFCLYAEDAGVFGQHEMFGNYLRQFTPKQVREEIIKLFKVLDTKPEERDPYMADDLAAFPYVNGGVFAQEDIEIPRFTDEIVDLLINKASASFDWSEISPTIFGAVFESTLNPQTRRSGGMHYTSIENIHKVIDPLFLDDLKAEFAEIKVLKVAKTKKQRLWEFRKKLAKLTFLDPAAGSGNFLTETYISLRRLENAALNEEHPEQKLIGYEAEFNPIQVSISQFYGIEINDFAVTVAKTALWIAERQMMKETEEIIQMNLNFLPLKSYANIVEGNALQIDWGSLVPKEKLNYIMGNPPFVGKKEQKDEKKNDLISLFPKNLKGVGNLDYVSGWYVKAIELIKGEKNHCAFVSTNSITQGEQVPVLWKYLSGKGLEINFAYRTFKWDSESTEKAHVHCVIIGFSCKNKENSHSELVSESPRFIIDESGKKNIVQHINGYLVNASDVYVENRIKPICNVPGIVYGSMPIDNNHLILSKEQADEIIAENPANAKFVRKYVGGDEIIKNKVRYCLWLKDVSPNELRSSKLIAERIKATKEFRLSSSRPQTVKLADTPWLFGEIRQPETLMLAIPKVSSEKRAYIPLAFVQPEIIVNGSALIVPDATLYVFGILMSNVHNAWMRVVAGRMKSDYQYSASVVYNNFPFVLPETALAGSNKCDSFLTCTDSQKTKIESTAQSILDARALYPDCSLADLYDETVMPSELRKAHQENDRAVMSAYGFNAKLGESEIVAELFKMYEILIEGKNK